MAVSSSLLRVPVEMPDRSGHNLSHSVSYSAKTGSLVPLLCHELLPNDTISLGANLQVQLPPMVTDFYGRVDYVLEAFFVPNRLCWGGWQDFITHPTANPVYPEGTPVQAKPTQLPFAVFDSLENTPNIELLRALGCNVNNAADSTVVVDNLLPVIAYHRIWDDWYRDSRVQSPLFFRGDVTYVSQNVGVLPYVSVGSGGDPISYNLNSSFTDGVTLGSYRQRNWVKDYFTSASPLPQAGGASEVKFDVADSTGAFSISTLRAANSLQRWMERNNIAGYRYSDQIYAQFGIYPSDAIMDRPLYLGRTIQTVYNRSVFDTTSESLGKKGANSQVLGEGSLVDKFTASEHGFLIVLASLVPRPVYSGGASRMFKRSKVGDFAFPLLAGMGDQAIKNYELGGLGITGEDDVFGYTDLYAEYKFINDRVFGLLEDGQSLDSFVLQRSFVSYPDLGSDFLLIPTDYLDQVQTVATSVQGYTFWAQIYFPFKKISTIPAYSQPTLADLKHAHTEYISRGGKRL